MRELYVRIGKRFGVALAIGLGAHFILDAAEPILDRFLERSATAQEKFTPYETPPPPQYGTQAIEQLLEEMRYER